MDLTATILHLLREAPGDALCDPCLAFAVQQPLLVVRKITQSLAESGDAWFHRGAGPCASCRRQTTTVVYVPPAEVGVSDGRGDAWSKRGKCTRCSYAILDDDVVSPTGEIYHRACWAIMVASKHLGDSRRFARDMTDRLGRRRSKKPEETS